MARRMSTVAASAVAALALVALVAGLLVATAKPAHAMACMDDGVNFMGQQPSSQACFSACFAVHGDDLVSSQWNPTTGCCRCFF